VGKRGNAAGAFQVGRAKVRGYSNIAAMSYCLSCSHFQERKKMVRTIVILSLVSFASNIHTMGAQASAAVDQSFHLRTSAEIDQERSTLLDQARQSSIGVATVTFETHPTSTTMMVVRVATGQGELHQHMNDYFLVLDGAATEVVGGTIEGGKDTAPGEIRGDKVVGGTDHLLHKGDVVYIPAGTPHHTIIPKGTVFTYFMIKVKVD
jgi:mannose-6-phosphate isomerase-like protein (cupin superfamily)